MKVDVRSFHWALSIGLNFLSNWTKITDTSRVGLRFFVLALVTKFTSVPWLPNLAVFLLLEYL